MLRDGWMGTVSALLTNRTNRRYTYRKGLWRLTSPGISCQQTRGPAEPVV